MTVHVESNYESELFQVFSLFSKMFAVLHLIVLKLDVLSTLWRHTSCLFTLDRFPLFHGNIVLQ